MQVTVKQHYVPACYLARFTAGGERDSPFFVYSLDGSLREDVPNHVGFERHYHTIDIPDLSPDHLEYVFQDVEAPACALFKELSANPGRPFLTQDEIEKVIHFFAIQAARVPQSKRQYEKMIIAEGETFMRKIAYSKEFFDEVVSHAIETGVVDGSVNQEALREAFESGDIFVVPDKSHVAIGMFRLASGIADLIEGMNCTLWYSNEPDWFVCSDYPVGLFYSLTGDVLQPKLLPDIAAMYMPLAKNVALVIHESRGCTCGSTRPSGNGRGC